MSTSISDTGRNTLIISMVISGRLDHYATRANGVGGEIRTRDLSKSEGSGFEVSHFSASWEAIVLRRFVLRHAKQPPLLVPIIGDAVAQRRHGKLRL